MNVASYAANYNSALSFLKLDQKDSAIETLRRALSQVPQAEKVESNCIYLSILSALSFLLLEKGEPGPVGEYVEQGLAVKKNHADLLFVKTLLLLDAGRFDEMLEAIINLLLALDEHDAGKFDYKYVHEGALKEIYDNLIPTAYRYALHYDQIRDIVERLCKAAGNARLERALDSMRKIDALRSTKEN